MLSNKIMSFMNNPQSMQKWEYMFFRVDWRRDTHAELNDLGQDGWELVAAAGAGGEGTDRVFFVLKRPC
jgi:hypothetical protein